LSRVVLITGPMRSGTSMVAEIVHRLGYPVSVLIPAPGPPSWRSDWEDPALTMKLMRGQEVDWKAYVDHRERASKALGFEGRVAIKSPYLALYKAAIEKSFPRRETQWIVCVRADAEVERSMLAHPALSRTHQKRIRAALEDFEDVAPFEFDYFSAQQAPFESVTALAEELDFDPYGASSADILAAAALIGQPTEYPCLQSSPQ
jgi:hypothetical protein